MLWRFSVANLEIAANDMLGSRPGLSAKVGHRNLVYVPAWIGPKELPVTRLIEEEEPFR